MSVTIRDVARLCGVSVSTVSRVLNGYTDISAETVELVRRTARAMHYMPNAAARLLKTNISHNIGVLFMDESNCGLAHEYFSLILNSVKEEAEAKGYDITFISQSIGGKSISFLEHCRSRRCDGVVIACVNFESDAVKDLVESEIPVVTIDYCFDGVSCVLSDNEEGAYSLTDSLIRSGHSRIAFIHGERTLVTEKRIEGYRRAMEEFHCDLREEYLVEGRYHDPESSGRATRTLMALDDRPTAILFSDDYSYLGGATELEKQGMRIPDDISAVGYDGIYMSTVLRPRLTTWFQDAKAIGHASVERLIEVIDHPDTCSRESIKVSGKMLKGCTTKSLK